MQAERRFEMSVACRMFCRRRLFRHDTAVGLEATPGGASPTSICGITSIECRWQRPRKQGNPETPRLEASKHSIWLVEEVETESPPQSSRLPNISFRAADAIMLQSAKCS